jgi:hypothetical protein
MVDGTVKAHKDLHKENQNGKLSWLRLEDTIKLGLCK